MSQIQPTLDIRDDGALAAQIVPLSAPGSGRRRRWFRAPGWVRLLLSTPKGRVGVFIVFGMVALGLAAPLLVSSSAGVDFSLLDARQAPSWHHLFGTTSSSSRRSRC